MLLHMSFSECDWLMHAAAKVIAHDKQRMRGMKTHYQTFEALNVHEFAQTL